jgi:hypothetical protein
VAIATRFTHFVRLDFGGFSEGVGFIYSSKACSFISFSGGGPPYCLQSHGDVQAARAKQMKKMKVLIYSETAIA